MTSTELTLLIKQIKNARHQSQKHAVMATCTGLGTIFSVIVGGWLSFILQRNDASYWGSVLASIILLPISWLVGIAIWDFLRDRWFDSNNTLSLLKFAEDELHRNISIIERSGLSKEDANKHINKLVEEYNQIRGRMLITQLRKKSLS